MPTTITKTDELTGAALDCAVAMAEGYVPEETDLVHGYQLWRTPENCVLHYAFEPSSNWAQGGPIIHREQIGISSPGSRVHRNGGNNPGWGRSGIWTATTWHAGVNGRRSIAWHETNPLVAAMRCFVASKLGDEVEVPDELLPTAKESS